MTCRVDAEASGHVNMSTCQHRENTCEHEKEKEKAGVDSGGRRCIRSYLGRRREAAGLGLTRAFLPAWRICVRSVQRSIWKVSACR